MNNKELWRTVKFVLFSVSAGIIQIGVNALLVEVFQMKDETLGTLAYAISYVASVLWNFTFNRRYTFKSNGNLRRAMLLVAAYSVVFFFLSSILEKTLIANGCYELLATGINMLLNFVTEFLYQRFVVYRKSLDTNELAQK